MRKHLQILWAAIAAMLIAIGPVSAQDSNFADRKALILDISPHVQLANFRYGNRYVDRRTRFEQNLTWTNAGKQPLVAFEIVILKYDAFDERLTGSRWTVTGKNSADWRALGPGESNSDGTSGYGTEEVYTAIAYVRYARLADGTVWRVNEGDLAAALKRVAPGIRDFGSTKPDAKPKSE